ncbi:MAG TPA: hypothetical protein VI457_14725 [Methylococcaceae bacterium]|nr:hypothetical protein [Methylococcaceae bacterium]
MKRFLLAAALAATAIPAVAADVGVSISIGEPGFYGRLDIGNFPQPRFIFPQPVLIRPAPVGVVPPPLYLRVPPGHAKHWSKHCHEYNACGQPVYFVEESWYNDVYVPRYRESRGGWDKPHGDGHGKGEGHGKSEGRGKGNPGRGKGHGKD